MTSAACVHCGGPIDENRDYQQVTGWEKRRSQGGTNAIKLREPQGVWACCVCIDGQATGIIRGQTSLI